MKKILIFACSFLIMVFIGGGFWYYTQKKEKKTYLEQNFVAKINGEEISLEDFKKRLEFMVKTINIPYNKKQFGKNKFKNIVLQNLIEEKLLLAEAKKLNLIDEELLATEVLLAFTPFAGYNSDYILFQNRITKEVWQDAYKTTLIKKNFYDYLKKSIKISPQEIENYYRKNSDKFIIPKQHEILHLQIDSIEVARFLEIRIKNNADFENLILEYSIAESKSYEGNSSFFVSEGRLPKLFNDAIFKLTLNNPNTSVIESQFGYHIFQLKQIIARKKLTLDDASPLIIKAIQENKITASYKNWLTEKRKISEIIVNQEVLDNGIQI